MSFVVQNIEELENPRKLKIWKISNLYKKNAVYLDLAK